MTSSHDGKLENMLRESYSLSTRAPEWRKVFHLGNRLAFKRGTVICMGGEKSDLLYFIEKGEVRLKRTLADGREKIIFYLQAGAIVGEAPFFDKLPALSSIVAGTNCVLYAFNRETVIQQILPNYPSLTLSLLQSLACKVRMLSNQSVELSLKELPARICRFLYMRIPTDTSGQTDRWVQPALNQQELASLLGVHRVTLNKALRELEKEGILGPYSKNEVCILDRERLKALSRSLDE